MITKYVEVCKRKQTRLILLMLIAVLLAPYAYAAIIGGFNQLYYSKNFTINTSDLRIYTSNATRVYISDTGQIGIRKMDPNFALDVNGTINATELNITDGITFGGERRITWPSTAGVGLWVNGSDWTYLNISYTQKVNITDTVFVNSTSGRVGIGIINATSYLDIIGSTTDTASLRILQGVQPTTPDLGDIYSDGDGLYYYDGSEWQNLTAAPSAGGWTDDGDVVRLTDAGNLVGIGTDSPSEKLYVSGNGSFTGDLIVGGNLIGPYGEGDGADSQGWVDDGTKIRLATTSDLVGIGTIRPTAKLQINASIGSAAFVIYNTTTDTPYFFVNETTGYVGIGTGSPSQALEVAGQINATGTESNTSFSGDVTILGTLFGGSPLSIGGGLNITGVPTGEDAFMITGPNNDTVFRISGTGEVNISPSAGNTSFDSGTLFVDSTNNRVGIGTTTPGNVLEVNGDVTIGSVTTGSLNTNGYSRALEVRGGTATAGAAIYVGNSIDDNSTRIASWNGVGSIMTIGAKDFELGTNNAERLTVNGSSGNVGINARAPTSRLQVDGTVNLTASGGNGDFIIDSSGNVGIGTTTPGNNTLSIVTGASSHSRFHLGEAEDEGIYIDSVTPGHGRFAVGMEQVAGSSVARDDAAVWFGMETNDYFVIGADTGLTDGDIFTPTARFVINSTSGDVGIGTTAPTRIVGAVGPYLNIKGTQSGIILENSAGANRDWEILNSEAAGDLQYYAETSETRVVTYEQDGSVFFPAVPTSGEDVAACFIAATGELIEDTTTTCASSSKRYKEEIKPLEYGLKEVLQLKPVSFKLKSNGRNAIGLIAEDIEPIIPELVAYDEQGRVDTLHFYDFNGLYVKSFQELNSGTVELRTQVSMQQEMIDELKENNQIQQSQIQELKQEIEALKHDSK